MLLYSNESKALIGQTQFNLNNSVKNIKGNGLYMFTQWIKYY